MIAFAESIENPEDHDSIQIILENTIGVEDQFSTPDKYKEKYNKHQNVGYSKMTSTLYNRMKLNRVYFMIHYEAVCKSIIQAWR